MRVMFVDPTGTVFFDLNANSVDAKPGGITVDADGNLWIACLDTDKVSGC